MNETTPESEAARLQELAAYAILDTPPEEAFDRIARLAATFLGKPVSLLNFVDRERQFSKATVGWNVTEIPREHSFCAYTIQGDDLLEIRDAARDPRFANNPLVLADPNVRFYAGAPLTTRNGNRLGALCVIDGQPDSLTETERATLRDLAQLAVDQMDLRLAGRDAAERAQHLRALHEAKDNFLSSISHELRTPLTSMRGAIGLLRGGAAGEMSSRSRQLLDMAQRNADQLLAHVNDLLDVQRVQSGRLELDRATQDVDALVGATVEANQGYAELAEVRLTYRGAPETQAYVDPTRVTQIVENLVSNACKFSPSGSEVRVALASTPEHVTISVSDEGPGIPADIQSTMYERFSRSTSVKDMQGSGIGLYMVRELTNAHGGSVDFETSPGRGTTFFVRLPRTQANSDDPPM